MTYVSQLIMMISWCSSMFVLCIVFVYFLTLMIHILNVTLTRTFPISLLVLTMMGLHCMRDLFTVLLFTTITRLHVTIPLNKLIIYKTRENITITTICECWKNILFLWHNFLIWLCFFFYDFFSLSSLFMPSFCNFVYHEWLSFGMIVTNQTF